jgi:DnaJ like chaperone protein
MPRDDPLEMRCVDLEDFREMPYAEIRKRYRSLVAENHPDRAIARGLPNEFIAIANRRMAAINDAFSSIERALKPA